MKCDECRLLTEAYFDRELDRENAVQLEQHLRDCAQCAGLVEELETETGVYLSYEPGVEVRPELWTQVQSRIGEPPPTLLGGSFQRWQTWLSTLALPRVPGWATVGLVLVAVGLTVAFMKYVQPGKQPVAVSSGESSSPAISPLQPAPTGVVQEANTEVDKRRDDEVKAAKKLQASTSMTHAKRVVRESGSAPQPQTPDQLVRDAERKYLAAIAMLTRTVERKRSQLDAPTLARLELSLASVDRTIAGTRKLARQHPDDPVAVQYMLTAYSRKVDVLREMIGY